MRPKITRRDLLKLAGGASAGILLTPVPWKLVDDLAIWTQTGPLVPKLPRGIPTVRNTTCTLCPAGCAVRARCVAGRPVALVGSRGGLCPAGLGGHHLADHPRRVRGPGDRATALAALASARGPVAIVDPRPGRALSRVYAAWIAGRGTDGWYVPMPCALDRALGPGRGLDIASARTVISFGAPVLEPPVALPRGTTLVQVEPRPSPTAVAADQWIPIAPGDEGPTAHALADLLEGRAVATDPAMARAARMIAEGGPAVALPAGNPGAAPWTEEEILAVARLNAVLGARLAVRRPLPDPPGLEAAAAARTAGLAEIPDRSLAALLVDGCGNGEPVDRPLLRRKLAPGGLLIVLAPHRVGLAADADLLVPVPAFLEEVEEAATPPGAPRASLALSAALRGRPEDTADPVAFLAAAGDLPYRSAPELVEARVAALHATGRGNLVGPDGSRFSAATLGASELRAALDAGARWEDDPGETVPVPTSQAPAPAPCVRPRDAVVALPWAPPVLAGEGACTPLLSKLHRESGMPGAPGEASLHPDTAARFGLVPGRRARVETVHGALVAPVRLDPAVRPGIVHLAMGADPERLGEGEGSPSASVLAVCGPGRLALARLREA